jgi:hypothetical protein
MHKVAEGGYIVSGELWWSLYIQLMQKEQHIIVHFDV